MIEEWERKTAVYYSDGQMDGFSDLDSQQDRLKKVPQDSGPVSSILSQGLDGKRSSSKMEEETVLKKSRFSSGQIEEEGLSKQRSKKKSQNSKPRTSRRRVQEDSSESDDPYEDSNRKAATQNRRLKKISIKKQKVRDSGDMEEELAKRIPQAQAPMLMRLRRNQHQSKVSSKKLLTDEKNELGETLHSDEEFSENEDAANSEDDGFYEDDD